MALPNPNAIELVYFKLATRIKYYRKIHRWSTTQLAIEIGINRDTIANIEGAKCRTTLHRIQLFAEIFNVSPDEFIAGIL